MLWKFLIILDYSNGIKRTYLKLNDENLIPCLIFFITSNQQKRKKKILASNVVIMQIFFQLY